MSDVTSPPPVRDDAAVAGASDAAPAPGADGGTAASDAHPSAAELVTLAASGREDEVAAALGRMHPADIAELLDALEDEHMRARLLAHLDGPRAAVVLTLV